MENSNKSFAYGLAVGIAFISTVALLGLVGYIFTGGRSACLAQNGNGGGTNTTDAKKSTKFEECLASGKFDSKISADQNQGASLGVQGTPATFINGYLISGALPYEAVSQLIDSLLKGEEPAFDFLKDEEGKITKVDMPQITDSDHKTGAANGKIVYMEFSDFECPYCGRFATQSTKLVKQNYANDVTIVFKHFPLSFHQNAKKAAVATECANEQGKFWEMHDKLFDLNVAGNFNAESISKAATELGLK